MRSLFKNSYLSQSFTVATNPRNKKQKNLSSRDKITRED
jgi:hypothetical protein